MKYNSTYSQIIPLKDTIKIYNLIKDEVKGFFLDKYSLLEIQAPSFFPDDSEYLIPMDEITRSIGFDTGADYRIMRTALSNTNWLVDMFKKIKINTNEGLLNVRTVIWRDLEDDTVTSQQKHEMYILVKKENSKHLSRELRTLAQEFNDFTYQLAETIEKKYGITNIFPQYADYITARQLELEYPNDTKKNREREIIIEKPAIFFSQPGVMLYSGQRHSNIPPMLYDLDNQYILMLQDRVNKDAIKTCTFSMISMGDQLWNQLNEYNLTDFREYNVYKSRIEEKDSKIIEFKMNIPRYVMALLGKGHISEVQPAVFSEERNSIVDRFKVEAF